MLPANQANTKTALIVAGDPWTRVRLAAMLSEVGYLVSLASNGFSGLRLARLIVPQVVLLDLVLSDVAGPMVLRELRDHSVTCHARIIVMVPSFAAAMCLDVLEADAFLRTPVVHAELLAGVCEATPQREDRVATEVPVRLAQGSSAQQRSGADLLTAALVSR